MLLGLVWKEALAVTVPALRKLLLKLQSSQMNFFWKLWKVPEPFLEIHTHSPLYLLTLSVKSLAPSAPMGGGYWVIFCLVQSKKFQEPQERLKFPGAESLFCRIIQIFKKVAPNGGHFQNGRKSCLHTR